MDFFAVKYDVWLVRKPCDDISETCQGKWCHFVPENLRGHERSCQREREEKRKNQKKGRETRARETKKVIERREVKDRKNARAWRENRQQRCNWS